MKSLNFVDQWLTLNKIYFKTNKKNLQFFNMFKYRCPLVKRMKIENSIEEMFRKILLKIDHFHRVKKGILYIKNEASICYHGNGQKKNIMY